MRLQMAGISADIEDPPLKNGPVLEPDILGLRLAVGVSKVRDRS